jgi:long-chain fatty acid transport protein
MRVPGGLAAAVVIAVVCSWCAGETSAHASPEDIYGWGARSSAMGGTGAAWASSSDAAYVNPALLSRVRQNELVIGFSGATFDLHADGAGLPGRVSEVPAKGYSIGVAVPIPFGGILEDRIAVGLAGYTPTDVLSRVDLLYPETPAYPLLAERSQVLGMRLGAGADIGWGLRVGAGVGVLAQLQGNITVASVAGAVQSNVDTNLVATYAPTVGLAWDVPWDEGADGRPRWRVGATWRGSLDTPFSVTVDASKLSSLQLPLFNIAGVPQYDPETAVFEVAREGDGWTLAAGISWKRWSQWGGVYEPTIICPATQTCSLLSPPQVTFSDTFVPRVGAEKSFELPRHAALKVRGGFLYEPTPVGSSLPSSLAYSTTSHVDAPVPTRFFDASRYVVSLGGGVDFGDITPFSVDMFVQVHELASTTVDTPPAAPATLSGTVLAYGVYLGTQF